MHLIYLSGPMSGIPKHNVPMFNKMTALLRKHGYKVINPAELDAKEHCRTWEACLRRDIRELSHCTDIATLPGWTKSRGAKLEVHIGKALSYEIHPVKFYLKKSSGRKNEASKTSEADPPSTSKQAADVRETHSADGGECLQDSTVSSHFTYRGDKRCRTYPANRRKRWKRERR